ncbi:nucleoside phosphorylase [Treponema vincentii]|uniref:nucleoside phosphorylase n=1 Tax=Treponema vincentii TaxID=69710 RepID=UPI0035F5E23D
MSIFKHELPILEFDTDTTAVIAPTHEGLNLKLPQKAVFAFLGDYIEKYAKKHSCTQAGLFVSSTKSYPIYITQYEGTDICFCQAPVGAAAAVQILDWLIGYGVTEIISTGSCGVLEHFPENVFLVPVKALRDEGTSYHYAKPSRFIELNTAAIQTIKATLNNRDLPYTEVVTWSTDGFYRETKAKIAYRKAEGCSVVEMECAALAACAQFRGAIWGELLFTADTLANSDAYSERNWGIDSYECALQLCFDAAARL